MCVCVRACVRACVCVKDMVSFSLPELIFSLPPSLLLRAHPWPDGSKMHNDTSVQCAKSDTYTQT